MRTYIYNLVASDEEKAVCELETRQLLNSSVQWSEQIGFTLSTVNMELNRSPYLKWKLAVIACVSDEEQCITTLQQLKPALPFRLNWLNGYEHNHVIAYSKHTRRKLEKQFAEHIKGQVQLNNPPLQYGITIINGHYYIGEWFETANGWLQHAQKPRQYSTALSTRLARSIINIALPNPAPSLTFVDPCCGIGTVLLEAAALGVQAEGYDLNPVVLKGTRENLNYFAYNVPVKYENMLNLTTRYDVAVLDLPYNLCSVLPEEEKRAMIKQMQQLANRYVIVTIEPIAHMLEQLNITVLDYAVHYKGKFKRELFLCGQ